MTFEWRNWKDNELLCVVEAADLTSAIRHGAQLLGRLYGMSWVVRVKS
jgi:hypothetical protein